MPAHSHQMPDAQHAGLGEAWLALADELQRRLRETDPAARVNATLDPNGLLELELRTTPANRAAARRLARDYEERARRTCEHCGGGVTIATAGPVVTLLCAGCVPTH